MPVPQASSAGSRDEPSSKRARHSTGTEEELIDVSDETEDPADVDLEDTSGGTVPRATATLEASSSQAAEEGSEEDEESEDGDRDED